MLVVREEEGVAYVAGWFDEDKATVFEEQRHFAGEKVVSQATGTPSNHEALLRTNDGRWVLHRWSPGSCRGYRFVLPDQARAWLLRQNHVEVVERYFGEEGRAPVGARESWTVLITKNEQAQAGYGEL